MFKKKQDEGHAQFAGRGDGSPTVVYPVVFETTGNLCKASAEFLGTTITGLGVRLNFKVGPPFDWLLRRCRAIIGGANHNALTSFFQNSRVLRFGNPEPRQGGGNTDADIDVNVGGNVDVDVNVSVAGGVGGVGVGASDSTRSVGIMSGVDVGGGIGSSSCSSSSVGLRRRSSSFPSSSSGDVSVNVRGSSSSTSNASPGGRASTRTGGPRPSIEVDFAPGSDEEFLYRERSQRGK